MENVFPKMEGWSEMMIRYPVQLVAILIQIIESVLLAQMDA